MFLKSIEVQGFKSFANKMVFEFNKGITGIVGPNGSGKSNVADAVRWVLGEQSAKQLRSSKMEDVIFSGTENRKALGFAYVAITLDNGDHALGNDYDTVTVSRRVYRSGESEYKINGHSCRLRDIQEMFFDTGIGKEGYSIIGQGQIDKILSGKPEDRRELFDEAAGIVKYKRRKALTEKNLAVEQQNLDRVRDILHELERQVGPLSRQSETAKLYLQYRDTLRSYEANLYLLSFEQVKKDTAVLQEKLDIVTSELLNARNEYEQTRVSYEEVEKLLDDFDKKISDRQALCGEQAVEKQRLEGNAALLNTRQEAVSERERQFDDKFRELEEKLEGHKAQEKELHEQQEKLLEACHEIAGRRSDSQILADHMAGRMAALREQIDSENSDIIEFLNEVSNIKGKLQRYEAMEEQARLRKSELTNRLMTVQTENRSEDELVESFEKESADIACQLEKEHREQEKYHAKADEIAKDLVESRNRLTQKEKAFHEERARLQTLSNVVERYDGYGTGIRKIMEQKSHYSGIIGVVADIIHVKKEYETAIETGLGGSISNVVTKDEATAKAMIGFLKQNRYGRATFLPLTSIKGHEAENADKICKEKGVIGLASRLISCEPEFLNLANYLLGRVFVVDHIDHALALARKYHYSLKIVTLEGESLNPGGSLSGGAYKQSGNLLGRRREIDELKVQVEALAKEIQRLRTHIDTLQEEKDSNKKAIEHGMTCISELSLRQNTVRLRLKQVSDSRDDHVRVIEEIGKELDELNRQLTQLGRLCQEMTDEQKLLDEKQTDAKERINVLSQELSEVTEQEKAFNEQTADIRIEYANLSQQQQFNEENILRNQDEIRSLKDEQSRIVLLREELSAEKEAICKEMAENEKQLVLLAGRASVEQEALEADMANRSRYASDHRNFLNRREELSGTMSDLDKEEFRLNHQKERLEENRMQLSNYMWEEYGLTYQGANDLAVEELLNQPVTKLKKSAADVKNQI